ncbi:LacI family DNA-binding transcriptional regulator [Bengtsoniella intestinalis]|uniref:LacI family DNA-binding transcriptional regulator n=1 Tax=Bengtsoniella intestinalis TaxID=3073143 RepID=UPI00391F7056
MAKMTAKQIAQSLGVSTAAVSLALNGKPGLGAQTREKILTACKEAGFAMPQTSQPQQPQQKTLCFMIFVDELLRVWENSPFYAYNMQGVEAAATLHGYNTMIRYLQADSILSLQNLNFLKSLDGLILLGTDITPRTAGDIRTMLASIPQTPTVIMDNMSLSSFADCVGNDNHGGAYQAVTHLVNQGCRHIAYLCARTRIPNFDEREVGVMDALRHANLPLFGKIQCSISTEEAYQDLVSWFQSGNPLPDGIFAENDVLAAAATRAMTVCGISVPNQVSIIGFDNLPITEQTHPPLSTIHSYKDDLGATAVEMVIHRRWMQRYCQGRSTGTIKVQMSTELVKRKSVRNMF